ncbi:Galactose-1-phosphate uridylyltransferase, variant 2 [Balamuthia mandrillaris]
MEAKANAVDFQMRVKNNVQFRVDPLTGGQSRINPSRATRPTSTGGIDSNLQEIVEKAKSRDPFLPEVIFEKVPRFPESLGPDDGRIIRGETVIFPNLHPFAENHAVAVMSNAHYLPLLGFTQTQLKDTLLASQQFMNAVSSTLTSETGRWYPTLVWNYMPPSAGSIIHPHMQIFVEERPTAEVERVLDLSSKYAAEHKSSYYADLAATEEKLDQRFVAKNEQLTVLTPFAPRGFNEVAIYFPVLSPTSRLFLSALPSAQPPSPCFLCSCTS